MYEGEGKRRNDRPRARVQLQWSYPCLQTVCLRRGCWFQKWQIYSRMRFWLRQCFFKHTVQLCTHPLSLQRKSPVLWVELNATVFMRVW